MFRSRCSRRPINIIPDCIFLISIESSPPHATGSREILHVAEGRVEVAVWREPPKFLDAGDTIIFPADLPHSYRNRTGLPAALYLVMIYPERAGHPEAGHESIERTPRGTRSQITARLRSGKTFDTLLKR
jgi:hypothetical protein